MRKPRAVIFEDDVCIRNLLTHFLIMQGYECLSFDDPTRFCTVGARGSDRCEESQVCSDILITDICMPVVNGLDLLELQHLNGCRLDIRNKAVISGELHGRSRERLQRLGCVFFQKPFALHEMAHWLAGCNQRLDLNLPLSAPRPDERHCWPG